MLNANKVTDIKEISKYGKAKGFLLAKRYKLPTFSNFFIIESEDEAQALLDIYKDQNDFCMRSDAKIGDAPIGIGGQNGNRETIFEYIRKVRQKSNELDSSGVAIIYWNDGDFCQTYETEGSFYLDYRTQKELIIDYVGKGWDGSYLSHGSACHETYVIPWEDILFLDDNNRRQYRKKVVSQSEYAELRAKRIYDLTENKLTRNRIPKEIAEAAIPDEYEGINHEHFRQIINQVIIPMYDSKDLQRYYKEYIPIVQIENGKIIVPEVIVPERLKKKEMSEFNEGR